MDTMKLAAQGDKRKTPDTKEFRLMTVEEAKLLSYGDHPFAQLNSGRYGVVKVNGAPKTWKRDPYRVEVPTKYGMYEYATFYRQPDGSMRTFNGNPLLVAV